MIRKLLPLAAAATFFAPGIADAGTPINQTRAVDPDVVVDITNVKGAVNVRAWDKAEVEITGTLGEGSRGLAVGGGEHHLEVKVEGPDKSKGWLHWGSDAQMEDTTLEMRVPVRASLSINVVSAGVVVAGLGSDSLQVDSVSGRVKLDAEIKRLRVDAVSGDVEFSGRADDVNVETVSGDIQLRGTGGRVHTETVSGAIRVEASQPMRDADASSVSGDIEIHGALDNGGRIHVESMSGDARLRLPGDLSSRLRAETFSGSLRSDFGAVEKREHGPGSSLDVKTGGGDGDISVETFSGDVAIQRD